MGKKSLDVGDVTVKVNPLARTATLDPPKTRAADIDHSLELKMVGSKAGLDKAECTYTAKVTLNKEKKGSISADYKLGPDMKAVATCPITSLSAQGLGKPTFTVETTYEF